jgi:hypothetical protein
LAKPRSADLISPTFSIIGHPPPITLDAESTRYDPAAIETIAGADLVLERLRASRDVFA